MLQATNKMTTGGVGSPTAATASKTPKKTQLRKHSKTPARAEENKPDGTIKTEDELVNKITAELKTLFNAVLGADKKELEDILDCLNQFNEVLDHHPDHGKLLRHIGIMQYQIAQFRQALGVNKVSSEKEVVSHYRIGQVWRIHLIQPWRIRCLLNFAQWI